MSITRETVVRIAELARLRLEDAEVESLMADLDKILAHVAELEALDTSNVPPTLQMSTAGSSRPDEVVTGLTQAEALAEAPRSVEGGFAVPGFMDES